MEFVSSWKRTWLPQGELRGKPKWRKEGRTGNPVSYPPKILKQKLPIEFIVKCMGLTEKEIQTLTHLD